MMRHRRKGIVTAAALLALFVCEWSCHGADGARTCSISADAFVIKSGWERRGDSLASTAAAGEAVAEVVLPEGRLTVWVRLKGKVKATVNGQARDLGEDGFVGWKEAGEAGGRSSISLSASGPGAEVYEVVFTPGPGFASPAVGVKAAGQDGAALWLDFDEEGLLACRNKALGTEVRSRRTVQREKGPWGGALRCRRSGLTVENGPSFSDATDAMTASAWVRADETGGYRTVLFKGERSAAVQAVYFDLDLCDGKPELKFKDAAGAWQGLYRSGPYDVPAVKAGEWSHLAATFDRGMVRLYLNGLEAASREASVARLVPNAFPLRIGEGLSDAGVASYPFSGLIDDVKIYARALTPREVAAEYDAGCAAHSVGVVAKEKSFEPDPKFERKLKIVEAYEKDVPKDVIGSAKTTASVGPYQGVPALFINDKPVFPMAMIPIGHFPKDACRDFAAAGVHVYSHIIWHWERGFMTPEVDWWSGPGQYDFEKVDRQILSIVAADPQAYIFLRVKLNPPAWWVKANPDELACYDDGRRAPQCSLASEVWEETYERMLRDLIRHVEGSPYAGHIIGYQPAGGSSSEWYWWGHDKGLIDYSPAACKLFRKWLKERYHGDAAALQKAWDDPQASFETAEPPGKEAREATECMLFRQLPKAGQVMDFQRFLSYATSYNIIKSCRICKEETGGRKITGVFYGYSLHYAAGGRGLWNLGFLGLKDALDSPYVDFLCAPTDYQHRRGGEPGNFISAYTASYILHNKLYWDEADARTHLYRGPETWATKSLAETLAVFERGFGYMLTKGTALWWFTLAGDHTWHQEEMMDDIARMEKAGEASMAESKEHIHDVAVLVDEETFCHMRMGVAGLTRPLIHDMHEKLAVMGAPFDLYLLSDIASEKMPDYRLYLFLNPFYLSNAMREAVKKKVRKNGAVSVWFYAPGFIQEDGSFSEEAMRDLTGIRLRCKAEERPVAMAVTHFAHPITSEVTASDAFDRTENIGPVFWADDPEAVVLGRLAPDGAAGMVVRDFGSWRSVYCASPAMPTAVLRGLIRYAGGHVYSASDDALYANRSYLMLHTVTDGKKHIVLPRACTVYDVLQGKPVGENLSAIDVELPVGVTRIYRIER